MAEPNEELDGVSQPQSSDAVPNSHPTGFYFFFWGEFAERCSYYGMRAILFLYLKDKLNYEKDDATELISYYKAACYLLPLLGGFLADRFFGKYWTIVGFSVPYVIGQCLVGVENRSIVLFALCLCAFGSGVIKPNISSLMGQTYDQLRPGKERLRASAFLWFYFSINVGSTLSMLLLPAIRDSFGFQIAFSIPAVFMAAALLVFALGKKHYAKEVIGGVRDESDMPFFEQMKALMPLFGVFALMVFFWAVYEQNDNIWIAFIESSVNRPELPSWLGGKQIAPDQFQFLNPALILLLVPFSQWLWPRIDPKGTRFPATTKMLIGFLFSAAAPAVMAGAAVSAKGGAMVSMMWIVVAYTVFTIGEVLVYGTGLDLSYSQAPKKMKGFITACFLLTDFIGNMINSRFGKTYDRELTPTNFFVISMGIDLAAAVAFFFVGRKFNRSIVTSSPEVEMEKP
ncbi:MAG TPA: oligopeptide:H+ symporter [Fimbriiglobus sp.]